MKLSFCRLWWWDDFLSVSATRLLVVRCALVPYYYRCLFVFLRKDLPILKLFFPVLYIDLLVFVDLLAEKCAESDELNFKITCSTCWIEFTLPDKSSIWLLCLWACSIYFFICSSAALFFDVEAIISFSKSRSRVFSSSFSAIISRCFSLKATWKFSMSWN